jgi:hypothetical protein
MDPEIHNHSLGLWDFRARDFVASRKMTAPQFSRNRPEGIRGSWVTGQL